MTLTAFMTADGPCYVSLEDVIAVSSIRLHKGHETRALTLKGGSSALWILNDESNRLKLLPLLPSDAPILASKTPDELPESKPKAKRRPRLVTSRITGGAHGA